MISGNFVNAVQDHCFGFLLLKKTSDHMWCQFFGLSPFWLDSLLSTAFCVVPYVQLEVFACASLKLRDRVSKC